MVKLLIFDVDGTLFHTAKGIHLTVNRLLQERNEEPLPYDLVISFIGDGLPKLLQSLDAEVLHRLGDLKKVADDFRRIYREEFLRNSILFPNVYEVLSKWPHHLAIASNKEEYYIRELIRTSPLNKLHWTSVVGGNTLPQKKPHPQPLLEPMTQLSLKPHECIMVGDGLPDMLAAQRAQMKSIGVNFGYLSAGDLIASGAHAIISNYTELLETVENLS